MMLTNQRHSLFVIQVDFVRRPVMVFCRLNQPAVMADLSEVALPTRFLFLVLTPEDAGPNAIWEISEMGRSLGSMLGDKVILLYKTESVCVCVCQSVCLFLCSLCTATVLSQSTRHLASGIFIPSGWSWAG